MARRPWSGDSTGFPWCRRLPQWFDEEDPVPQSLLDEQVRKLERARDGTPTA